MKLELTPAVTAPRLELITAGGQVPESRHVHVVLAPVHRFILNLSVVTKAEWYNNSDTGFDDPLYDSWWKKQTWLVDVRQRRHVWKMEAYFAEKRLTSNSSSRTRSPPWAGLGQGRTESRWILQVLLHLPHPLP